MFWLYSSGARLVGGNPLVKKRFAQTARAVRSAIEEFLRELLLDATLEAIRQDLRAAESAACRGPPHSAQPRSLLGAGISC
jgi:hypothetical protein